MGRTTPESVISPVIANRSRTGRPVSKLTSDVTIAAPAVQQGQTGSYVYVVLPDGKAEVRPVTVAQISEAQALIDTGLQANETVVIDGQYRLQQGSPVQVPHGKAAREADLQSAVERAIP